MAKGFIEFLRTYGIMGLAIAVVIGGKVNELISSFVNDLLMPLVFQPALKAANLDDIRDLNYNGIFYGKFLGTLVDFLIVAVVVYIFAKLVLKEEKVVKK